MTEVMTGFWVAKEGEDPVVVFVHTDDPEAERVQVLCSHEALLLKDDVVCSGKVGGKWVPYAALLAEYARASPRRLLAELYRARTDRDRWLLRMQELEKRLQRVEWAIKP